MVAQMHYPRRAPQVCQIPAKRVRELLLELTYRLHATKVVGRLPNRMDKVWTGPALKTPRHCSDRLPGEMR